MGLAGKAFVVVGGTGGIGSEVARGVVREGGSVLLVARDEARLAERVADLDALAERTGAASAFAADAGSQAALSAAAAEAVSRHGRLDGWSHAVGSILLKPLSVTSEDDFARQLDLNAGSAFRALHAALVPMRKQRGGAVVLFGSAAAVLDLLSDGAANVTGAVLPADGGMAAGRPPATSARATRPRKGARERVVAFSHRRSRRPWQVRPGR